MIRISIYVSITYKCTLFTTLLEFSHKVGSPLLEDVYHCKTFSLQSITLRLLSINRQINNALLDNKSALTLPANDIQSDVVALVIDAPSRYF